MLQTPNVAKKKPMAAGGKEYSVFFFPREKKSAREKVRFWTFFSGYDFFSRALFFQFSRVILSSYFFSGTFNFLGQKIANLSRALFFFLGEKKKHWWRVGGGIKKKTKG